MLIPRSNVGRLGIVGSPGIGGGKPGMGREIDGNVGSSILMPRSNVGRLGIVGRSGIGGGKLGTGMPGNVSESGKLHLLI